MNAATRAIRRVALLSIVGLWSLAGSPSPAIAATAPEKMLPESTVFFVKVADASAFRKAFLATQYGQLWSDPAMKEFRDELLERLEDKAKVFKESVGLSIAELIELPQGAIALAAIPREDPKLPVAGILIADAGSNEKKMLDLLTRATKKAEEAGFKTSTESFNGLTIHIHTAPPEEKAADAKEDGDKLPPAPPIVWTNSGGLFLIGSDVDIVKDVASNREGRDKSLASVESFQKTQAKTDSQNAHAIWFLDVAKLVKLLIRASSGGDEGVAQQTELRANEMGADGLKSIGGCITLGSSGYDTLTKTFVLAPKPVSGLLKIFSLPSISMRPESWVPATVASYQSMSFDLDNAYTAINDLVNKFQPGMLNILEQQLVGPNGGQPLSLQQDIFGPLGDRVTLITDFKKPIKEDSQRVLMAVALEDAKAFQGTFGRILEMTQAAPEKREFEGTTIYEFQIPDAPNVGVAGGPQVQAIKGPVVVAIAKDALLVTTDASMMEQVLRKNDAPLAESSAFQTVIKELPEKVSGMTFVRPDEQARLSYDLIKSGQFEKAFQTAAQGARGAGDFFNKLIPAEKMPDFSIFARYLSLGGSYSVMDDDGFLMTGFSLRKANP